VIIATAIAATTHSSISCCRWGNPELTACSPTPTARHTATAAPTPAQTARSASGRLLCLRNAAMIPTISEASRPSRRPMTNVASIRDSLS